MDAVSHPTIYQPHFCNTTSVHKRRFMQPRVGLGYSNRSATIGSTRIARQAGIKLATTATAIRNNGTLRNASGSCALSPNRKLESTRETPALATKPISAPIPGSLHQTSKIVR